MKSYSALGEVCWHLGAFFYAVSVVSSKPRTLDARGQGRRKGGLRITQRIRMERIFPPKLRSQLFCWSELPANNNFSCLEVLLCAGTRKSHTLSCGILTNLLMCTVPFFRWRNWDWEFQNLSWGGMGSSVHAKSLLRVWLYATPWSAARQAPLSMGFSRQEYWSGLPGPPPGDLPSPGIKLMSLTSNLNWQAGSLPPAPPRGLPCWLRWRAERKPFSPWFLDPSLGESSFASWFSEWSPSLPSFWYPGSSAHH